MTKRRIKGKLKKLTYVDRDKRKQRNDKRKRTKVKKEMPE